MRYFKMDCTPNIEHNATIIDDWHRQHTSQLRQDKQYKNEIKKIRRTHICRKCGKYPGDEQFSFGLWENRSFTCFDCI